MPDLARQPHSGFAIGVYRANVTGAVRYRSFIAAIAGAVPVPEKDLPVTLPEDVDFAGSGNPLSQSPKLETYQLPEMRQVQPNANKTRLIHFLRVLGIFLRYADPTHQKTG